MLDHDSPYEDRTSDLIARIRKMREMAREQMDKFGDPAEYDVEILRGGKATTEERNDIATDTPKQNVAGGAQP
ncbi:MAG: hypothetical protein ACRD28_09290 [Acidobacteriaceae bacterium]